MSRRLVTAAVTKSGVGWDLTGAAADLEAIREKLPAKFQPTFRIVVLAASHKQAAAAATARSAENKKAHAGSKIAHVHASVNREADIRRAARAVGVDIEDETDREEKSGRDVGGGGAGGGSREEAAKTERKAPETKKPERVFVVASRKKSGRATTGAPPPSPPPPPSKRTEKKTGVRVKRLAEEEEEEESEGEGSGGGGGGKRKPKKTPGASVSPKKETTTTPPPPQSKKRALGGSRRKTTEAERPRTKVRRPRKAWEEESETSAEEEEEEEEQEEGKSTAAKPKRKASAKKRPPKVAAKPGAEWMSSDPNARWTEPRRAALLKSALKVRTTSADDMLAAGGFKLKRGEKAELGTHRRDVSERVTAAIESADAAALNRIAAWLADTYATADERKARLGAAAEKRRAAAAEVKEERARWRELVYEPARKHAVKFVRRLLTRWIRPLPLESKRAKPPTPPSSSSSSSSKRSAKPLEPTLADAISDVPDTITIPSAVELGVESASTLRTGDVSGGAAAAGTSDSDETESENENDTGAARGGGGGGERKRREATTTGGEENVPATSLVPVAVSIENYPAAAGEDNEGPYGFQLYSSAPRLVWMSVRYAEITRDSVGVEWMRFVARPTRTVDFDGRVVTSRYSHRSEPYAETIDRRTVVVFDVRVTPPAVSDATYPYDRESVQRLRAAPDVARVYDDLAQTTERGLGRGGLTFVRTHTAAPGESLDVGRLEFTASLALIEAWGRTRHVLPAILARQVIEYIGPGAW